MGPVWALGLLLGALGGAAGCTHSLRYFHTAMTDPGPGMPWYVVVGYVDDKKLVHYDSVSQRVESRTEWMVANVDQEYWDEQTKIAKRNEEIDRVNLDTLQKRYNWSGGSHTLQHMYGCGIYRNRPVKGYYQDSYDGRDFIAFDKDTMTFTAADAGAVVTKRKWEEEGTEARRLKQYLEHTCIEWLRRYLEYGKAVLERTECPEVRVSGKEAGGILTLSCRAHGFYPWPIAISWLKDGMVRDQDMRWGGITPNSDGTYHAWATIEALPGDGDKYQCRVEHEGMPQPGLYSWEPQYNLIPIMVGVVVTVVVIIAVIIGFVVWKSKSGKGRGKKEKGYYTAPGSEGGSSSSATGSNSSI